MDFVSARTNMVESQVRTSDVTDLEVIEAMRRVARERFCAPARAFSAYAEVEPEICPGRSLMKPRDIGKLLQAVHPRPGDTALCIAAPYAAALLATIGLKVTAQEGDARAAAVVEQALDDYGVRLVPRDLADPEPGPWGLIVCEASVTQVPGAWLAALAPEGRLAAVEGSGRTGQAKVWVRGAGATAPRIVFDAAPPMLAGFEKLPTFQF